MSRILPYSRSGSIVALVAALIAGAWYMFPGLGRVTGQVEANTVFAMARMGEGGPGEDDAGIGETIRPVDDFELVETPQALVVTPMVTIDRKGGFLVADIREAQIRRYGEGGDLLWSTGRKGRGPGEFVAPGAAVRLGGGEVVAVDRTGRLTRYDSAGASVLRTDETELNHVEEMVLLGDTALLLGGVLKGDHEGPRLHLWDLRTHSLRASFFSPLSNAANRTVSFAAGWTKASVRHGSVAATFATSDTVYIFDSELKLDRKIPLSSRHFRRGPRAEPTPTSDPAAQARWMSQYDFVEAVYWLADGTFLVAYQSVDAQRGVERRRHLVHMDGDGKLLFESRDGPRLLEVDTQQRRLFFVHPDAELPNRWQVAHLR